MWHKTGHWQQSGLAFLMAAQASVTLAQTPPAATARPVVQPVAGQQKPATLQATTPTSAAPPAPNINRTDFIATMDAEFRRKDANGDGKLTRAEVEEFERAAALQQALIRNRDLFIQLDTDRNGQLSLAEFQKLVPPQPLPDVRPTMNRFDTNHDQQISLIEYRAATLANFDRLDTDHDGVVTPAEMNAGGIAPTGR